MTEYKEDDLVLCTVKAIEGTTAFIEIDDKTKGTISFSEIAPGRIRNIREFVTIGKKIVCKVLRVKEDHLELSLRRVTTKEKEAVLEADKKEKVLEAILKPILKEKTQAFLEKIAQDSLTRTEFFDKLKANPELTENYFTKPEAELVKKALKDKKEKEKEVKKTIILKSPNPSGLKDIKSTLNLEDKEKSLEINYLGSSKFSVSIKGVNAKHASAHLELIIKTIQDRAKQNHVHFEAK